MDFFGLRGLRGACGPRLELAQAVAGFVEVVVLFGEAESQQVFAAAGAEEGGAGYGGYAGGGEQMAGLFGGGSCRGAGWLWPARSRRLRGGGFDAGVVQADKDAGALVLVVAANSV
jgi:hypothetical protein